MRRCHFVLLVLSAATVVMVGYGPGSDPTRPTPTPTPTLDATTRGYISLLRIYFVPWAQEFVDERTSCGPDFVQVPLADQAQQMRTCRPLLVPEIAAGKTLIAQLATAQPPAKWQQAAPP